MFRSWKATIKVGVFWDGPTYELCRGPHWWVRLRAELHLIRYPYRAATIAPVDNST